MQYSRYREMARNIRNKTSSSEETPSSIDTPIMKAVQKLSSTLGQVAYDVKQRGILKNSVNATASAPWQNQTSDSSLVSVSPTSSAESASPSTTGYSANNTYNRRANNANFGNANRGNATGGRGAARGRGAGFTQGNKRFPGRAYPNRDDYCFYHSVFGERADHCREGCVYFQEHPDTNYRNECHPSKFQKKGSSSSDRAGVKTVVFCNDAKKSSDKGN